MCIHQNRFYKWPGACEPALEKLALFFTPLLMNFNDYVKVGLCVYLNAVFCLRVKKLKKKNYYIQSEIRNISACGSKYHMMLRLLWRQLTAEIEMQYLKVQI